jgi:hypothetical protein
VFFPPICNQPEVSAVPRLLAFLTAVLLVFLVGGGLLWYLAYGVRLAPPAEQAIPHLVAPVEIGWHAEDGVSITAETEADGYAALGYVHATWRTWPLLLMRQAALGQLSAWFGPRMQALDAVTLQLALAETARQVYTALPEADQALLRAYTTGLNAALARPEVQRHDALVLLNQTPTPWEPWHPLAVERLLAWIATPPPSTDTLRAAGAEVAAFFAASRRLRDWLHLHSLSQSVAWAIRDTTGTFFFQRQVYGSLAWPFLQEVHLRWDGQAPVLGVSLPGTPFLLAGRTATHAWALLADSPMTLERMVRDSTKEQQWYARITDHRGHESLVPIRRIPQGMPFAPPLRPSRPPAPPPPVLPDSTTPPPAAFTPPPDSTWVLRWAGLRPVTDWRAWRGLLRTDTTTFRLLSGAGLAMQPDGTWRVLGQPRRVYSLGAGIFVGNTPWADLQAQRLQTLAQDTPHHPERWMDDLYSPWAATLTPQMVRAVSALPADARTRDALAYLQNWDYAYDGSSIAASLLDTWLRQYRDHTGRWPAPLRTDTLTAEHRLRGRLLAAALDQMEAAFGPDMSQWRWERTLPDRRFFAPWPLDTLADDAGLPPSRRFSPLAQPGRGHPSTLAAGASLTETDLPATAVWEGWMRSDQPGQLTFRRQFVDLHRFLARYLVPDPVALPVTLSAETRSLRTTTLRPLPP